MGMVKSRLRLSIVMAIRATQHGLSRDTVVGDGSLANLLQLHHRDTTIRNVEVGQELESLLVILRSRVGGSSQAAPTTNHEQAKYRRHCRRRRCQHQQANLPGPSATN